MVVDNLFTVKTYVKDSNSNTITVSDGSWLFGILRIRDMDNKFYWSSHIMLNISENHIIRYGAGQVLNTIQIRLSSNVFKIQTSYIGGSISELESFHAYYFKL